MSRRRGEFEHRTSIFEGAFRAWSHLGGLAFKFTDLETLPEDQLDPLVFIIENDSRADAKKKKISEGNEDANRKTYPYEPLPRSGLAHPFIQAILSPWLGPDAEQDAIQLGLTTLRTWWQHRRKGESASAVIALSTEKMQGVVDGYTRHFFKLAYALVMKDGEQPPRTLMARMKEVEKIRNKKVKKRTREDDNNNSTALNDNMNLEAYSVDDEMFPNSSHKDITPLAALSNVSSTELNLQNNSINTAPIDNCGNPDTFPLAFISSSGDATIFMSIDGISCAPCVKIIETVVRGCNGAKPPLDGVLDCVADQTLNALIVRIDSIFHAKRIAFAIVTELTKVGYDAKTKDINFQDLSSAQERDVSILCNAFDVISSAYPTLIFDWTQLCTCTPLGIEKENCPKHSQMNHSIIDLFEARREQILSFLNHSDDDDVAPQGEQVVDKQDTATNEISSLNIRDNMDHPLVVPSSETNCLSGHNCIEVDE